MDNKENWVVFSKIFFSLKKKDKQKKTPNCIIIIILWQVFYFFLFTFEIGFFYRFKLDK